MPGFGRDFFGLFLSAFRLHRTASPAFAGSARQYPNPKPVRFVFKCADRAARQKYQFLFKTDWIIYTSNIYLRSVFSAAPHRNTIVSFPMSIVLVGVRMSSKWDKPKRLLCVFLYLSRKRSTVFCCHSPERLKKINEKKPLDHARSCSRTWFFFAAEKEQFYYHIVMVFDFLLSVDFFRFCVRFGKLFLWKDAFPIRDSLMLLNCSGSTENCLQISILICQSLPQP